jgi:EAL domain-containing protein (putative c-di-GMP-specific phosphodiesterase class I)
LLPAAAAEQGVLLVCPPLGHTLAKLRQALADAGIYCEEADQGILSIDMESCGTARLARELNGRLTTAEEAGTRCLHLEVPRAIAISDLGRMQSLQMLLARARGRWLLAMLENSRVETYFQPIICTERPDHVLGYECLTRGVTECQRLVMPGEMFDVARNAGLMFQLDRALRLRHIHTAVKYGVTAKVFINFNPTAIYDPASCLKSTVQAISTSQMRPSQFVFEVVESDTVADPDHLPRILDYYREHGYQIALDDFGAGYGSVNLLTKLRPDYIKFDMHLMRDVHLDRYKALVTSRLLDMAHKLNIRTICEGIETAEEYQWAVRHGADYVQGYLFGRPSPVPETATLSAI